jgi:hypothetical protein
MRRLLTCALVLLTFATASAQSDLDALMARVLERRDENWKKLQQYTLNERETLQVTALAVFRLFGLEREYLWFPRAGFFIRSPLKADGVTIAEEERRKEEEQWLRNAQNRERRRQERLAKEKNGGADGKVPPDPCNLQVGDACLAEPPAGPGDIVLTGAAEDIINQTFEPDFIRSANFLRFKFDQGSYALAGREKMLERDVLKIEYYPTNLFDDDKKEKRPPRNKEDEQDAEMDRKMEKVTLVTLWVDPAERQILRYDFRFQDLDFLPGRSIVRVENVRATMQMGEPFPNVWLPATMGMRFRMTSAAGPLEAKYDLKYSDYRLPTTSGRIQ